MLFYFRPRVIVLFIFGFVISTISGQNGIIRNPDHTKFTGTVVGEFPRKSDLSIYLRSLDKLLNFCAKHKNDIDLNFNFGLFLVNVNLRNVIKYKETRLPVQLRNKLKGILSKTDKLIDFFKQMAQQDLNPRNKKNKLIFSLFSNESLWSERLRKFGSGGRFVKVPSGRELEEKYAKWNMYMGNVNNVVDWVPNPSESDMCMVSLAKNPVRPGGSVPRCKVTDTCYDILMHGSDFGYALSHRMLLLLMARLGRGCVLFTQFLDRELTKRFCASAYGEAEFIAMNGYQVADLMLEQILFCALDGHTHFLRRSWLSSLLKFQTPEGCFNQEMTSIDSRGLDPLEVKINAKLELSDKKMKPLAKWKFIKHYWDHDINNSSCNGHVTSVAAATIATGARFILTNCY